MNKEDSPNLLKLLTVEEMETDPEDEIYGGMCEEVVEEEEMNLEIKHDQVNSNQGMDRIHDQMNSNQEMNRIPDQMNNNQEMDRIHDQMNSNQEMDRIPDQMNSNQKMDMIPYQMNRNQGMDRIHDQVNSNQEMDRMPDQMNSNQEMDRIHDQVNSNQEMDRIPDQMNSNQEMNRIHDKVNSNEEMDRTDMQVKKELDTVKGNEIVETRESNIVAKDSRTAVEQNTNVKKEPGIVEVSPSNDVKYVEKTNKKVKDRYVYRTENYKTFEARKKIKQFVNTSQNGYTMESHTRTDLFQQPFVRKVLENHIYVKNLGENDELPCQNGYASFVDPKRVCRLCMNAGQDVFIRLFYTDHQPTPIAEQLSFLIGEDKVKEDLLPQQICLQCSEAVHSSYGFVKQSSDAYEILYGVVDEIKEKTHVFRKDKKTAMYLKINEECYEFCPYDTNADQKKNNRKRKNGAKSIECHVCNQSFLPEALKEHMSEEHDCLTEYKCIRCHTIFPTLLEHNEHNCIDNDVESDTYCDNNNDDSDTNEENLSEDKPFKKRYGSKKFMVEVQSDKIFQSGTKDSRSCKYCNRIFKSMFPETHLKAHVLTHQNVDFGNPDNFNLDEHIALVPCYICTFCKAPKTSRSQVKSHLTYHCTTFKKKFQFKLRKPVHRNGAEPAFCKTCADDIPYNAKDFSQHVRENHPEDLFKCSFCPKTFLARQSLALHNRNRHVNQEKDKSVMCEHCSRVCKSYSGYRQHVIKAHMNGNDGPKKRCRRKPFSTRKIPVPTNVERLRCPICNVSSLFKNGQAGLDFHILKHNSPTGTVYCCNREFKNFVKYSRHMKGHSRTWNCRHCGMHFESCTLLRDHACAHGNIARETGIYCRTCHTTFSNKKDLRLHRRTVHWDEDETGVDDRKRTLRDPVVCCGWTFYTRINLLSHQKSHQDTPCKSCGDVLNSRTALKKHVEMHHAELRKECAYCNKTFYNTDALKYHMLKHTQGRIFKCPCGYSFYTEFDMRRHQMLKKEKNTPCVLYTLEEDNNAV